MDINLLHEIIKYCNGFTIYQLSLINKKFNSFIKKNYFFYALSYNNFILSDFYPNLYDLNKDFLNINNYNIHLCIRKKFIKDDIDLINDPFLNYDFIGRIYYIILHKIK
jgi:hypothetical protein